VSTFYLLPPRPLLGQRFAGYLDKVFPGLSWASATWPELAEALAALAARRPDVYVVFGEELPPGEEPARALAAGFGAEAGDEVIELALAGGSAEITLRRWQLTEVGTPSRS
jgi:hypothetical protein